MLGKVLQFMNGMAFAVAAMLKPPTAITANKIATIFLFIFYTLCCMFSLIFIGCRKIKAFLSLFLNNNHVERLFLFIKVHISLFTFSKALKCPFCDNKTSARFNCS